MTHEEIYKECLDNNHAARVLIAEGRWVPTLCNDCQKKIDDSIYQARVERDEQNYKLTTSNYSKTPNPILSHDELLARLDDYGFGVPPLAALRAVVELHKPRDYNGWKIGGNWCVGCNADFEYPCPTIQAIKKELG